MEALKNLLRFSFFFLIIQLAACRDDKNIVPPEVSVPVDSSQLGAWERHPEVKGDNFISRKLFVDKNKLFCVGGSHFMSFDATHKMIQSYKFSDIDIGNFSIREPYINNQYFVYSDPFYNPKFVKIHLVANPSVSATINVSDIDSTYQRVFYEMGQPCAIVNDKLILPSVRRIKRNDPVKGDSIVRIDYFHIYTLSHTDSKIDYKYEKTITINDRKRYSNVEDIFSLYTDDSNFYYVLEGLKKVNLSSGGHNLEANTPQYGKYGFKNDTIWGLGFDRNIGTQITFKSNVWNTLTLGDFGDGGNIKWYFLDNKHIIGVFEGRQIFELEVDLKSNKFSLIELLSSGTRNVNDIAIFKDRVYFASNDGLFYKSVDSFFTKKKPK